MNTEEYKIWGEKIGSLYSQIIGIISREAELRGKEFQLQIDTETERLLSMGSLEQLKELLEILKDPQDMSDALKEHFDAFFGVRLEDNSPDSKGEEIQYELRMAA